MAGLKCSLSTDSTRVALTGSTAKTVLQIAAPTNQRLYIYGLQLTLDAAIYTDIVVMYQSTAGTGGTSRTPKLLVAGSETVQTTGLVNIATAEPTSGNVIKSLVSNAGMDIVFPYGMGIWVPGGSRVGIVCTSDSNVDVLGTIFFEE